MSAALIDRCCTKHISALRADSGRSLQVQTYPAETLEADVQATLKRRNFLHRRKAALSPERTKKVAGS